jgi:hypothetical protein
VLTFVRLELMLRISAFSLFSLEPMLHSAAFLLFPTRQISGGDGISGDLIQARARLGELVRGVGRTS